MVIKMIANIRGFRLYGASMVAAWAACGIAFCLSFINHVSRIDFKYLQIVPAPAKTRERGDDD